MIKIQGKFTTLKTQVPQIKRPLFLRYELQTQSLNTPYREGLLSKFVRGIKKLFTTETTVTKTTYKQTPSTYSYSEYELQTVQNEYQNVYNEYCKLLGLNAETHKFGNYKSLSLYTVKNLLAELKLEVSHEQMMLNFENIFTKGADYYFPEYSNYDFTMDPTGLTEIIPDRKAQYKKELKRICEIFIENSHKVDVALSSFNDLTADFFREASKSIKEIYALKNDNTNRILERIPKLGIIPKALRVKDQIRLTKCVMKDYESVTDICIAQRMEPLMQIYAEQYNTIKDYISHNKINSLLHKKYTDSFMSKMTDAKNERLNADSKMLNVYAACGMNLSNMCNSIRNQGLLDLARKTAITFATLF